MASQSELKSINCTQCGAPLALRGGHKVRSITCGYCGSVLDTHEQFAVVKRYKDMQRPRAPVEIGMRGTLKGVEFTVIGMVQWRSQADGYSWLEFMIFSPTHGYAWLEYESGHFVFSRRVRDVPHIPKRHRQRFKAMGHEFELYDAYRAKLVFVEGELTWVAEVGDVVELTEGIAPPMLFARERTAGEEEYLLGEYLPAETVFESFGIKGTPPRTHSVHAAQPYTPHPVVEGVGKAARIFAPLCAVLAILILLLGNGSRVVTGSVDPAQATAGASSPTFSVDDANSLLALDLRAPVNNAWAFYNIGVRQNNETVLSMARNISYYSGYSGGESWSEGGQEATALFKVPAAGEYTLFFTGEGGQGNSSGSGPPNVVLTYELKDGVVVSRYFLALTILFAVMLVGPWLHRRKFEAARWDEDDDDD